MPLLPPLSSSRLSLPLSAASFRVHRLLLSVLSVFGCCCLLFAVCCFAWSSPKGAYMFTSSTSRKELSRGRTTSYSSKVLQGDTRESGVARYIVACKATVLENQNDSASAVGSNFRNSSLQAACVDSMVALPRSTAFVEY